MTGRFLFLDFDGVLNSQSYIEEFARGYGKPFGSTKLKEVIDRRAVERLNRIIAATGAAVVISSAWRLGETAASLERMLRRKDFVGEVLDLTPPCDGISVGGLWIGRRRGDEIAAWMKENDVSPLQVAILDDDSDMGDLALRHVKTSFESGLLDEHVERAIQLLSDMTVWQVAFHNHLDACVQCREQPFNLCAAGASILKREETP